MWCREVGFCVPLVFLDVLDEYERFWFAFILLFFFFLACHLNDLKIILLYNCQVIYFILDPKHTERHIQSDLKNDWHFFPFFIWQKKKNHKDNKINDICETDNIKINTLSHTYTQTHKHKYNFYINFILNYISFYLLC